MENMKGCTCVCVRERERERERRARKLLNCRLSPIENKKKIRDWDGRKHINHMKMYPLPLPSPRKTNGIPK